ncbi:MAG: hypothetical protein ING66_12820 [Rhodocyclaceae bacterium]|nr:hypothetical protein [Rhodocyclaceae bacterium]MCA3084200.1 hypothetical protein [Rhodocyclaceae bacterium]
MKLKDARQPPLVAENIHANLTAKTEKLYSTEWMTVSAFALSESFCRTSAQRHCRARRWQAYFLLARDQITHAQGTAIKSAAPNMPIASHPADHQREIPSHPSFRKAETLHGITTNPNAFQLHIRANPVVPMSKFTAAS